MISHIFLGTNDPARATAFYAPIMEALGWRRRHSETLAHLVIWNPAETTRPLFVLGRPFDGQDADPGNGGMVALLAPDRPTVVRVYDIAMANGARCEGKPGLRPQYHANYYGAYFRDLDGNKVCAVCHQMPPTTDRENEAMPASMPEPRRALDIAPRAKPSNYPSQFAERVAGRVKRQLGDAFGLLRFGVNLTVLPPGAQSALLHRHTEQEEFVYILSGHPTLRTDAGEAVLEPGMCVGFPAGGVAHHLINRTGQDVHYLEVGDRSTTDQGEYPEDDLAAQWSERGWRFTHKDGTPW